MYTWSTYPPFLRSPLLRRTRAHHFPRHKSRRKERGKKNENDIINLHPTSTATQQNCRPATCSIRGGKLALQTISILPGNLWKANIHAKRWRRRSRNTYYYIHTGRCGGGVRAERCGIYIYIYVYYILKLDVSLCRVRRAVKFIKSLPSLLTERANSRRSENVAEY